MRLAAWSFWSWYSARSPSSRALRVVQRLLGLAQQLGDLLLRCALGRARPDPVVRRRVGGVARVDAEGGAEGLIRVSPMPTFSL